MDDVVNRFAKELADAIAAAVAENPQVEACRDRAREAGYEMRVTLEAVVGFLNRNTSGAPRRLRLRPACSLRSASSISARMIAGSCARCGLPATKRRKLSNSQPPNGGFDDKTHKGRSVPSVACAFCF